MQLQYTPIHDSSIPSSSVELTKSETTEQKRRPTCGCKSRSPPSKSRAHRFDSRDRLFSTMICDSADAI